MLWQTEAIEGYHYRCIKCKWNDIFRISIRNPTNVSNCYVVFYFAFRWYRCYGVKNDKLKTN